MPRTAVAAGRGPLPSTELHGLARDLGQGLLRRAVEPGDGSITWIASAPDGGAQRGLDPHLYNGTTGIALFFAALHRCGGEEQHRTTALAVLAPLRRKLAELAADPERSRRLKLGVGGFTGLGSFVYGFARVAALLEDPGLEEEAVAAAGLMTERRIREDEGLDLAGGTAGALTVLLTLATAGHRGLDGLTQACVHHLLDRRTAPSAAPGTARAWPGPGRPPISGFAHGAAGVSMALGRFHRWAREQPRDDLRKLGEEALDAALEGLAFETGLFDAEAGNWHDPRHGRLLEQSAWCHGAPGIVLGRLELLAALPPDGAPARLVRDDLERALELSLKPRVRELDHLCCGNLGVVRVLVRAAEALHEPRWRRAAEDTLGRTLERAHRDGGFHCGDGGTPHPVFDPGLLRGTAGIGYTLLTLAGEAPLPCPLCLE